jgi:hypothetical protein
MLSSQKPPTQSTLKKIECRQKDGSAGSYELSCYASVEVGHPALMCPNKEKVLATWNEKKYAANNGPEKGKKEKKEMKKEERYRA